MKLHYSQTAYSNYDFDNAFYYLMKLHYSQTSDLPANAISGFTTL